MARYQENPHRKKMWFGTQHHSEWIDCPLRNADMSPEGWGTEGTYLSGGGFSRQSKDSHRNYIFEWGAASSRQAAERMQAYRDGVYNKYDFDLLYFIDPLTYSRNILPKRWSQPGIVTVQGREIHSPLGRVRAIEAPSGILGLGVPMVGARVKSQSLVAFNELEHPKPRSVWVPIPEGETLTIVAWTGSDSGNNGLYARTLDGTAQKCGLVPLTFSGVPGVLLGTVGEFDFFGARAVLGVGDLWRDTVEYRWMGNPNLSTSIRQSSEGTHENLFTNPSFEAKVFLDYVTVWENYAPGWITSNNARFTNASGSYDIQWITEANDGPRPGITHYGRSIAISPTASGSGGWTNRSMSNDIPITGVAGDVITGSVFLRYIGTRESYSTTFRVYAGEDLQNVPVTLPNGEWVRVTNSVTATADFSAATWWAYFTGGNDIDVGGIVDCAGVMLVKGEHVPDYFDGGTSPDDDLWGEWTGVAGRSASRLVGQGVPGLTAHNGAVVQSSQWSKSGGVSARLINTGPYAYVTVSGSHNLPTGTVKVWRYQDKVLTPSHSSYFGNIRIGGTASQAGYSETAANAPGETLLTARRGEGNATIVLHGHFSDIGESVWFDLLTVTDTEDYDGPPFSGDTAQEGPEWLPGSGNSGCRFIGNPSWSATSGVNGGQIGYAATLKEVGDWQQ